MTLFGEVSVSPPSVNIPSAFIRYVMLLLVFGLVSHGRDVTFSDCSEGVRDPRQPSQYSDQSIDRRPKDQGSILSRGKGVLFCPQRPGRLRCIYQMGTGGLLREGKAAGA